MTIRSATARYEGLGKAGRGFVSTQSGVLSNQQYGFTTRFEDAPGTNPEELVAAAHASCFTMALAFALEREGFREGTLETTAKVTLEQDGGGFTITRSDLSLTARVPGIDEAKFQQVANGAKDTCPLSKLLKAEISLAAKLEG
jgi:osmotically inducible protein OsmC